jgi:hypothetical protein
MHRCVLALLAVVYVLGPRAAAAQSAEITARAAVAPNGDPVQLVMTSGGKSPNLSLSIGKAKATKLYAGEGVGSIAVGHGKVVVAYAAYDGKAPYRVHVVGGEDTALPRTSERVDLPYAVAVTSTPDGFSILFQEIEARNVNEAHTYLLELDKDGKADGELREVQIPWALGDMAWNGNGYHLALFYAGGDGVRLSMVSTTKDGVPQGHPDWASAAGLVSDVHLVADGKRIRAFYRGGMGDRLYETDVTKIGNWGSVATKAKDLGALGGKQLIGITDKGAPTKITRR